MGLSVRAYAKSRGVSHVAVLKAAKAGRIALEPDGTVDPAKADAAWERSTDPGKAKSRAKPNSKFVLIPDSGRTSNIAGSAFGPILVPRRELGSLNRIQIRFDRQRHIGNPSRSRNQKGHCPL